MDFKRRDWALLTGGFTLFFVCAVTLVFQLGLVFFVVFLAVATGLWAAGMRLTHPQFRTAEGKLDLSQPLAKLRAPTLDQPRIWTEDGSIKPQKQFEAEMAAWNTKRLALLEEISADADRKKAAKAEAKAERAAEAEAKAAEAKAAEAKAAEAKAAEAKAVEEKTSPPPPPAATEAPAETDAPVETPGTVDQDSDGPSIVTPPVLRTLEDVEAEQAAAVDPAIAERAEQDQRERAERERAAQEQREAEAAAEAAAEAEARAEAERVDQLRRDAEAAEAAAVRAEQDRLAAEMAERAARAAAAPEPEPEPEPVVEPEPEPAPEDPGSDAEILAASDAAALGESDTPATAGGEDEQDPKVYLLNKVRLRLSDYE